MNPNFISHQQFIIGHGYRHHWPLLRTFNFSYTNCLQSKSSLNHHYYSKSCQHQYFDQRDIIQTTQTSCLGFVTKSLIIKYYSSKSNSVAYFIAAIYHQSYSMHIPLILTASKCANITTTATSPSQLPTPYSHQSLSICPKVWRSFQFTNCLFVA